MPLEADTAVGPEVVRAAGIVIAAVLAAAAILARSSRGRAWAMLGALALTPVLLVLSIWEAPQLDRPNERPFALHRNGAAGMQRFGATCWSGDINNDFATLEAQIPLGLNTGLSGVPYWGTDVGGFFHPVPETGELYARWFQLGAFSPIFRSHGWVWREHVPWAHGEEVEAICREYAELRYRLLPYTYTLAWQAHTLGLPLMRPLVLNYPDDPRVWGLGHEFLWGDDLLVAPVTREGARAWPVYLPSGGWYDWHGGEAIAGRRYVVAPTPMDRIPLYARAGAVVPMWPEAPPSTAGHHPAAIELHLFVPTGDGTHRSFLQEDDGLTLAARDGARYRTTFEVARRGDRVTLRADVDGDGYPEFAREAFVLVVHGAAPATVTVDGEALEVRDGRVAIANAGTGFAAELGV